MIQMGVGNQNMFDASLLILIQGRANGAAIQQEGLIQQKASRPGIGEFCPGTAKNSYLHTSLSVPSRFSFYFVAV
jgi:hypothetical protein